MNRAERRAKGAKECEHPKVAPDFDAEVAKKMTAREVRATYPRFSGKCPDCDYEGILYASFNHYISGDW